MSNPFMDEKRFGAVVLCRYDSMRLPGKALRQVNGHPILWYVLSRCMRVAGLNGQIVVATSDREVDDPIVRYCESENITVYRGSVTDVAGRALGCAQAHGWDYFFRVNGDSPFPEAALLNQAIEIAAQGSYDIITNLQPRSYPYGVSVELINTGVFASAYQKMSKPEHFEHVTKYLYENLQSFRYFNITNQGENLSQLNLTIDTEQDFNNFETFIKKSGQNWPTTYLEQAIEFYRQL